MPDPRDDVVPTPAPGGRTAGLPGGDADRTLAFRRSLRVSRARRDAAERRRRRSWRGRGSALVLVAGLIAGAGGAVAHEQRPARAGASAASGASAIVAAQRALGVAADGIVGPRTRRATRGFQRRHGLPVTGIIDARTLRALGVPRGAGARSAAGTLLDRIAACESGGNPRAVSANGMYRGKYQFSRATWRQVGGTGDPAAAPEAEQDRRAATLLARAGRSAWPSCA
jgi:peptidoglycan hydrolase-like protein with peptidoglycan-binding domain